MGWVLGERKLGGMGEREGGGGRVYSKDSELKAVVVF